MEEEKKKSILDNYSSKQTFLVGGIGGFLVLCTVGFFVLLVVYFKGGLTGVKASDNTAIVEAKGPKQFSQCLDSGKYASTVSADEAIGGTIGVQGTPATFINGYLISGAYPYAAVKEVIDDILAGGKVYWDNYKDFGLESGDLTKVEIPELPNVVWKGDLNAPITVVEFSDFECPYCAKFYTTMEQVLTNYGDKIKFTYRHFPLSFHANAQKAAEAYECAKEQGKGFEMYQKLFILSGQSKLGLDNYKLAATELGLK